ncbi:barstar family protein [Gordonia sp. PP30]|uniref:barstar family protein n=1 Tax=Gordonia sp. PP30 TaxID=2935861 RepID=UPI001FFEA61B|nr:barstar family protein [Gordonia sp. PP30]UQE74811.1 barstar family protein [Gordonia sp. PP30]
MSTTLNRFLHATRTGGPAVAVTTAPVTPSIDVQHRLVVRRLDGALMRTTDGLFGEFAEAWDFPGYFGWGMDAFNDCMTDLDGHPAPLVTATGSVPGGFLTVVEHAEQLLADAPDRVFTWFAQSQPQYRDSYRTPYADNADRPAALEYALVLRTTPDRLGAVRRRWTAAGTPTVLLTHPAEPDAPGDR